MKRTILAMAFLLAGSMLFAQQGHHQAPERVRQSFQRDYPNAANSRWSMSNGEWHANFTDRSDNDRGEMVAHYDRYGRHIDSHIPYAQNDVPAPVMERARARYHDARYYRYTRVERGGRNEDLFKIEVNLGGRTRTSYVDEQGHDRAYNRH
jgi:hypothetical protein